MLKNSTVNVLGCLTAALLISGCSTPTKPIEISTSPVQKPELVLPQADAIVNRPVQWLVITPENYEQVFADLEKSGQDVVLFGLTAKGYENLSLNANDVRTYMQQQNAIIVAYRNYYIRSQSALNGAVKVN
jgi:uncharacterized lipoprotein YajG